MGKSQCKQGIKYLLHKGYPVLVYAGLVCLAVEDSPLKPMLVDPARLTGQNEALSLDPWNCFAARGGFEAVKLTPDPSDGKNELEEGRKRLHELLEKVEGCSHVTDVPSRYLMHDADLVEMDITENTALHRVHGYLTNDGFMVSVLIPYVSHQHFGDFFVGLEFKLIEIVNHI